MTVACESDNPLRMTLVISSLEAGGAQRVMAILANHWAAKGWDLTLLTLVDDQVPRFFTLHPRVRHLPLGLYAESGSWGQKLRNNFRRLWVLRREIVSSRPHVVLSFMDRTNILVLLATRLLSLPVVVAEHTHPGVARIGRTWERLRLLLYPRASAIVVLTERSAATFPLAWGPKINVIPNPVHMPSSFPRKAPRQGVADFQVVGMGKLTEEKGFDLLLAAFALLASEFPQWHLLILGDGPLRVELEALCKQLGLVDRVCFAGNVLQPDVYLQQADLFVLSSRLEGFPMALCEAMACGVPVVASDCLTGPREIVRPGVDGLLVEPENPGELARSMAALMADESRRLNMGSRAREIGERFGLEKVAGQWEQLFRKVVRADG